MSSWRNLSKASDWTLSVLNIEVSFATGTQTWFSSKGQALPAVPLCLAQAQPAALTFLTVFAFVASRADTVPINTGAVAPAGRIDALVGGHITLSAFPATVALARPFRVLSIPTAQDGAGGCVEQTQSTRS